MNLDVLRQDVAGEVLAPGDAGYDDACVTYAAKGEPEVVVRPRDAAEVAAALRHAVSNSLVVSVRSGGHSALGFGTNTGGLVIDLTAVNGVEVLDPTEGFVRIGAGATWGEVAAGLQQHGLALSSGDTRSVGVGGLTLGGGVGWLVRKHGLTIDSMVAAEVVTADGRILRASEHENPDLFWAIRGGGGNFGVVVSFDFVAQPLRTVHAGTIAYRLDDLQLLLKGWREHMRTAPEELSTTFVLMPAFGGNPAAAMVFCCYAGDDNDTAMAAIDPLLRVGTVTHTDIAHKDYAEMLEDAQHPPEGIRMIVQNTLVPSLSDEIIADLDAAYGAGESGVVFLRALGGAVTRVAPESTAFAHRGAEAMVVSGTIVPADASDAEVDVAMKPWRTIVSSGSGAYANFQGTATDEDIAAIYPPATYARLAGVKTAYDPTNLFNLNHNIKPADQGSV